MTCAYNEHDWRWQHDGVPEDYYTRIVAENADDEAAIRCSKCFAALSGEKYLAVIEKAWFIIGLPGSAHPTVSNEDIHIEYIWREICHAIYGTFG